MTSADVVIVAVDDARQLARQAEVIARSEFSKNRTRSHKLTKRRETLVAVVAENRAMVRILSRILWIPIVRGRVLGSYASAAETADREIADIVEKAAGLRERTDRLGQYAQQCERNGQLLLKAEKAALQLGEPSKEIEEQAARLGFQSKFLSSTPPGMHWLEQVTVTTSSMLDLVKLWAGDRNRKNAVATQERKAITVAAKGAPEPKIYLPIPSNMYRTAQDLGAIRDPEAPPGPSPYYVTMKQDLQAFRGLLPIAYRPEPTRFEFPPIPYNASGQNLWSVFDRATWDRVRKTSYGMTGYRCAICGGRGGFIADKLLGPEAKRHGVEAHEVWEWNVEDPSTGVGIQRMKRLLVVCPSCHACYHSGHFSLLGREKGIEDEVRSYIEKRRMLINRVSLNDLNASLEETAAHLREVSGVDKWIIDLDHLGRQQYMTDHIPVLRERNGAAVGPDRIAGIAFETDAGDRFDARPAAEIYRELTAIKIDKSYAEETVTTSIPSMK